MALLQGVCVVILGIYLARRLRTGPGERRVALRRLGLLALASWVGEDSLIRAYGFYHYAAGWALFVDQVPLLIVGIWPVVVDSAWRLAGHLVRGPRAVALVGGCLVLTDAALIEPIAVAAGLWSWSEPGLFGVPPIGMLGWAVFAAGAIALLEQRRMPGWVAVL
ncbi:MAG: carotenoid biosynthesis protein, partial [Myxococcota bacterium]|nr:carotenoid biosynthesis protein [Myxococcota bacterium]